MRNVLIRGSNAPAAVRASGDERGTISQAVCDGTYTADELLVVYCTIVYAQERSYEGAARRLGLDRRTVKAKIDEDLLGRL